MAIKPEDCLKLTEAELKFIDECEIYIDNTLRVNFININSVIDIGINGKNQPYLNSKIINYLIRQYENVGWEVAHTSNEGGECLRFKKYCKNTEDYYGK